MKKIFLPILLLFISIGIFSQSKEELFNQANTDYRNGKFEQAIAQYNKIIEQGYQSSEIYYNLGNSYYKLSQIAPAIFFYEKALLLDPKNEDVKNNLAYAQRMAIDVIEPLPKTIFQRFNESVIYPISPKNWAWINISLALFIVVSILLYAMSYNTYKKRFYFILSFIFIALFLLALSMGIKAKHHDLNYNPAIIFAKEIQVKSEPSTNGEDTFVLHEGTKVLVLEQEENWNKIKLADGKTGWLPKENIKLIKE